MVVSGSYTYPDGSTTEVSVSDGLDSFDPIRLADMTRRVVGALADIRAGAIPDPELPAE